LQFHYMPFCWWYPVIHLCRTLVAQVPISYPSGIRSSVFSFLSSNCSQAVFQDLSGRLCFPHMGVPEEFNFLVFFKGSLLPLPLPTPTLSILLCEIKHTLVPGKDLRLTGREVSNTPCAYFPPKAFPGAKNGMSW